MKRILIYALFLTFALPIFLFPNNVTLAVESGVVDLLFYQSSSYRYQIIPSGQIPPPGFETAEFDDSSWATGAGAFGFSQNYCPIQSTVQTPWTPGTNLLVRRTLEIPSNIRNVQIKLAIDNDIGAVFWNGSQLSGFTLHENCPNLDDFTFDVPQNLIQPTNTLAFYMIDRGFESFFDVRVVGEAGKTPVLIVPGVLGTEIKKGAETLWADPARMVNPLNSDAFMDPLQLNDDLTPQDVMLVTTDIIRNPANLFDYTESLISEFISQGYTENTDLFVFPYDWRYGVAGVDSSGKTNVDYLQEKINEILNDTGSSQVDIVAHSTGGLVLKDYLRKNSGTHHVAKAVFVGVPHLGAPKATKTLLTGDNFGVYGLNDEEMKKIAKNLPVVYELAPSLKYYDQAGSWVSTIDFPIQSTLQDLNFDQTGSLLLNERGLNRTAFDNARSLHENGLDSFDPSIIGVNTYAIVGCKSETISHILEKRGVGPGGSSVITYDVDTSEDGDGTVPVVSSMDMPVPTQNRYFRLKSNHGKFLSEDQTRQQIIKIISGDSNIEVGNKITQNQAQCQKTKSWLFGIFSPVDVVVTDQDENLLQRLPDGSIQNNIPGAEFVILGEHKFVALPGSDGEVYDIKLQGTGNGSADIRVDELNNGALQKRHWYSNLPVTPTLSGNLILDNNTRLVLDTNGDNQILLPTSTLTPQEAEDFKAPEAHVSFDPQTKDLKITGTDNASATEDITITDNGDTVTLTDKAGNTTVLTFKEQDRRKSLRAELISLSYNGQVTELSKNAFLFTWLLDKQKALALLTQGAATQNNYAILAAYIKKFNITTLAGQDQGGKINQTLSGLHLLTVSTNQGELEWEVE